MSDSLQSTVPNSPEWRMAVNQTASVNGAEPVEETAIDRVARMLSQIGGGRSIVKLNRIKSGKREWCNDYSPSTFEAGGLSAIRDEWGAGEFEVVLYGETLRGDGKKHYGVLGRESIEIAPVKNPAPVATPLAPPVMNPDLARVLEMLGQNQQRILEVLMQRPEPVDPQAQMMSMLGMFKLIKEISSSNEAPRSTISEVVEAARMLRDVSGEFGSNREPEDPITAALPTVLELIKGSAQFNSTQQALPPVTLPQSLAAPAPAPAQENDSMTGILTLRAHLAMLIDLASKGESVESASELVFDRAPDEVIELLGYPNWFSMLESFEPKVTSYRQWFESVGAAVIQMIAADAGNENPSVLARAAL